MSCIEALLQIQAGSDSTGNAIRAMMLAIVSSLQVYRRLQEELDEANNTSLLSPPVSLTEAKSLPYLQVCHSMLSFAILS